MPSLVSRCSFDRGDAAVEQAQLSTAALLEFCSLMLFPGSATVYALIGVVLSNIIMAYLQLRAFRRDMDSVGARSSRSVAPSETEGSTDVGKSACALDKRTMVQHRAVLARANSHVASLSGPVRPPP